MKLLHHYFIYIEETTLMKMLFWLSSVDIPCRIQQHRHCFIWYSDFVNCKRNIDACTVIIESM